jgi:hypothetical protein
MGRFRPVRTCSNRPIKSAVGLNLEPDPRFGSRGAPNFEPDLGPVRPGPGSNRGSGPDRGITTVDDRWIRWSGEILRTTRNKALVHVHFCFCKIIQLVKHPIRYDLMISTHPYGLNLKQEVAVAEKITTRTGYARNGRPASVSSVTAWEACLSLRPC